MNYQAIVITFLESLGFETMLQDDAQGFLSNIDITNGVIRYSSRASAGDLLHEAGHLAILPGCYRAIATANLDELSAMMFEECCDLDPEDPMIRCLLQTGDTEATAWAWAAGIHLGLPPEVIIENHSYGG